MGVPAFITPPENKRDLPLPAKKPGKVFPVPPGRLSHGDSRQAPGDVALGCD
jgi:hypothetical protein